MRKLLSSFVLLFLAYTCVSVTLIANGFYPALPFFVSIRKMAGSSALSLLPFAALFSCASAAIVFRWFRLSNRKFLFWSMFVVSAVISAIGFFAKSTVPAAKRLCMVQAVCFVICLVVARMKGAKKSKSSKKKKSSVEKPVQLSPVRTKSEPSPVMPKKQSVPFMVKKQKPAKEEPQPVETDKWKPRLVVPGASRKEIPELKSAAVSSGSIGSSGIRIIKPAKRQAEEEPVKPGLDIGLEHNDETDEELPERRSSLFVKKKSEKNIVEETRREEPAADPVTEHVTEPVRKVRAVPADGSIDLFGKPPVKKIVPEYEEPEDDYDDIIEEESELDDIEKVVPEEDEEIVDAALEDESEDEIDDGPAASQVISQPVFEKKPKKLVAKAGDVDDFMYGVGKLQNRTGGIRHWNYECPGDDLLESHPSKKPPLSQEELESYEEDLLTALRSYSIEAEPDGFVQGPTVILFKLKPAIGVKVSKIQSINDDIARYLGVDNNKIRILATVEGTHDIGIEIPNPHRQTISFIDLTDDLRKTTYELPFVLGRSITGECMSMNVKKAPHLLIAGATGSGKSVCINSLIASLIYTRSPEVVRLIMIDPKVVELQIYNDIPHLLAPVITEPKKAIKALEFCVDEMERRYRMVSEFRVRNIEAYNEIIETQHLKREKMPYIVVIIDEFADLMTVVGKDLERLVSRLAAKARAIGINLVFATQRPSVDVITGTLKNNIPVRIAFNVPSAVDSKTIIDFGGAEKLLGNGDMLYKSTNGLYRIQGAFLSDDEVDRIVEYAKEQDTPDYIESSYFEDEVYEEQEPSEEDYANEVAISREKWTGKDEALLNAAWDMAGECGLLSATMIQTRLRIGYPTASRIMWKMVERGIVGEENKKKQRVLLKRRNLNA